MKEYNAETNSWDDVQRDITEQKKARVRQRLETQNIHYIEENGRIFVFDDTTNPPTDDVVRQ